MKELSARRWSGRGMNRRGIGTVTAAAILGGVVVAVGVVGFVVLNALEHANTTSSTVHSTSCSPSTAPPCADRGEGTAVGARGAAALVPIGNR